MKTIDVRIVQEKIREAVQTVNFNTPVTHLSHLSMIQHNEPSPAGKEALVDILENRKIAIAQQVPMCQDTGVAVIFVELGQDVHLHGGFLNEAITEGVRQGYQDGFLRKSVVAEPLFDRTNTRDNTPPVIHYDLVPGEMLKISVAAKGFGAENMSRVVMLTPAQGLKEVKRQVVKCVVDAGPNACPPIYIGVGVGGTMEKAALLAKKALFRDAGQRNTDPRYGALEEELLTLVNATGIGPQGWGGENTAVDVFIEFYPTHIGGLPLAINLDCHLHRHLTFTVE